MGLCDTVIGWQPTLLFLKNPGGGENWTSCLLALSFYIEAHHQRFKGFGCWILKSKVSAILSIWFVKDVRVDIKAFAFLPLKVKSSLLRPAFSKPWLPLGTSHLLLISICIRSPNWFTIPPHLLLSVCFQLVNYGLVASNPVFTTLTRNVILDRRFGGAG